MNDFPKFHWGQFSRAIIERLQLVEGPKGEWHGACPNCGYNDKPSTRFWISEHNGLVKTHCRQCNDFQAIQEALQDDGLWPKFEPSSNVVRMDDFNEPEPELNGTAVKFEPYHKTKQIDLIGAKLDNNVVVVPLFNAQKERVGEQRITPDGRKKFSAGLDKEGAFGVCGKIAPGLCYVAEGWATSVAVHMATGVNTVFALDAGNLPKVCDALQQVFPKLELVIAADNDEAGIKAVKASGRPYAAPRVKGDDWNDVWVRDGKDAVCQGLSKVVRPKALFTRLSDIEIKPPQWLVEGIIEKEALSMMFGASGAGKTFVALDLGLSVATGKDWHGKEVEQGSVIYVAGEGHPGFARRVAAWAGLNQVEIDEAPFYKSNTTVIINDEESAEIMMGEIDKIADQVGAPKLVVLDTMDRTLAGSDSDDKDTAAYLNVCDTIRERYGATVLIVHHVGHAHQERGRGSSRIKGRLDAEYRVDTWGETKLILNSTKMKDAEEPEPLAFLKVTIPLTTTEGEETTSLALEYTEERPLDKKSPEHIQSVILDQIKRIDEFGEVPRKDLKEAVALELEKSQRQADRDIKRLIDQGVLSQKDGIVRHV